jgi:cystathionine beta-lyase
MEVPDVPALVAAAKAPGIVPRSTTRGRPAIYFRAFEHGIDVSVQAVTKYIGGHSDLLMGSVTARQRRTCSIGSPACAACSAWGRPDDVYLALRGMPTMLARLKAHEAAALRIAEWLRGRPEVKRMLHPAFPDCPGTNSGSAISPDRAGLFSFIVDERFSAESVDAFIDGLRWFKIGYSWGGVASLAVTYRHEALFGRAGRNEPGHLVRLNIGLEDPADLIATSSRGSRRCGPCTGGGASWRRCRSVKEQSTRRRSPRRPLKTPQAARR